MEKLILPAVLCHKKLLFLKLKKIKIHSFFVQIVYGKKNSIKTGFKIIKKSSSLLTC